MTLKEYSKLAREFNVVDEERRESHALCGLVEEVGELMGKYKRALRGDGELDMEGLKKELGDIIWFVSDLSVQLGTDLEEIALMNLDKLSDRRARGMIKGKGDDR